MRPEILFSMFEHVTRLPGVGPRVGALIEKVAGPNIIDLCLHLPSGLVDRSYRPMVAAAEAGRIATLEVRTFEHRPGSGRRPFRVLAGDDTGEIDLVFFHARPDWIAKQLPLGEKRIISGVVERFQGRGRG